MQRELEEIYINFSNKGNGRFETLRTNIKVEGNRTESYLNTIKNIQNTFGALLGEDFEVSAQPFRTRVKGAWVCVCWLYYRGNEIFRTFGKGTSIKSCMASGLAELIERFQNDFLISPNIHRFECLRINEVSAEFSELNKKYEKIISQNNPHLAKWPINKDEYVPFRDFYTGSTIPLHVRYLSSSNGIASGNSYEEAFTHALCEFYERYCQYWVISNELACPNIPEDYLNKDNKKYRKYFMKLGFEILFKDFSLQKGFPVIGVLFKHKAQDFWELNVDSATNLNDAITRAFIEQMQMGSSFQLRMKNVQEQKEFINALYRHFPSLNKVLPFKYYVTDFSIYRNSFPPEFLKFLEKDEGKFEVWNYSDKDCNIEAEKLLNICKRNQWDVYYLDSNFIGFPSIRIVIPQIYFGLSEVYYNIPDKIIEFRRKLLHDFHNINSEDLDILLDPFFLLYISLLFLNMKTFFDLDSFRLNDINKWHFFVKLAKQFQRDDIVEKYLSFIQSFNNSLYLNIRKSLESNKNDISTLLSSIRECLKCSDEHLCENGLKCKNYALHKLGRKLPSKLSQLINCGF